jgi:ATP-dependent Lon protease
MALIESLPLFPLGLVLYPHERLPLHIFEERYKDLSRYCLENDAPFGIVFADEGELATIGCTARIQDVVNRYDDGRLDIVVEGEQRFYINEIYDRESYVTADVELLDDETTEVDVALKERVITQHMKLLELAGRTVRPTLYEDVAQLSYVLAQNAGLDTPQKQKVLELGGENERIQYLIDHFESLIPRVEQREDVRRRIRSNGHFKDFPPEAV